MLSYSKAETDVRSNLIKPSIWNKEVRKNTGRRQAWGEKKKEGEDEGEDEDEDEDAVRRESGD